MESEDMRLITNVTAALMALVVLAPAAGADTSGDSPDHTCRCLRSQIAFDVTSVEKIYLQPEIILEDPDQFWQEDEAYRLVKQWHDNTRQPLDLDRWRERIRKIAELSPEERESHPQLRAVRSLAGIEASFAARVIPYLCEYLPPEADLTTTIYFTTEIMASGFQQSGNIVVHILNAEMQNLFLHEIFHRGYASMYKRSGNPQPETDLIRLMYLSTHNEGLATYIAYLGQSEFPNFPENDYALLDDPHEVDRLRTALNELLSAAPGLDPDDLRKRSWELGVRQRAYYVVGAYMARVIEEKLGRSALTKTITIGPRAFAEAYNGVVADSLQFHPYPSSAN
jgi:hypothetical protein